MATIKSGKDVRLLLNGKSADLSAMIAIRAALRVLPLVTVDERLQKKKDWQNSVILPLVRSVILSTIAARQPRSELWSSALAAASSASSAWSVSSHAKSFPAAYAVSSAVAAAAIPSAAAAAVSAAISAGAQAEVSAATIWRSVGDDLLDNSGDADGWHSPLWRDVAPKWFVEAFQKLRHVLLVQGTHWQVFLDWYQDRLDGDDVAAKRGRPSIPEMEIEIATISDEDWNKGAKHVFGLIKEIQDRYWRDAVAQDHDGRTEIAEVPDFAPTQEPHAISFATTEDGRIDLASVADVGEMLLSNLSRQEDYTDLREKAEDIQSLGINRVGDLRDSLQRLLSLSGQVQQVRGVVFWSKANTLRKIAEGHQAALGDSFDERRLDLAVGDRLVDLVETINVFMIGDPLLRELDAARPGPQEAAAARDEVQSVEVALTELADSSIMTENAGEALADELAAARTATDTLVGRQRLMFSARTARNAVFALVEGAVSAIKREILFGLKEFRGGVYKAAGAGAAWMIWQFRVELISYAEMYVNSPALREAIKYVISFFA